MAGHRIFSMSFASIYPLYVKKVERKDHSAEEVDQVITWLTGYDRHTPHFRLSGDGGPPVDDGYFSIVLNTNPYTYLGNRPLDLSPAATLDHPLVAITFTTMSATAILSSLAGALRGGGVKPASHLDIREGVEQLVVENDEPFPYQVDGDALGSTRRLAFTHVPGAVRLVFPTIPAPPLDD